MLQGIERRNHIGLNCTQLAQLEDCQPTEWAALSSKPSQTINKGLEITGEIMLVATKTPFSVQMIASLGSDNQPLALSLQPYTSIGRRCTGKKMWHCSKRVADVGPSVMVYLTCAIIGLGVGKVRSNMDWSSSIVCFYIQPFAASDESWQPHYYCYY